MALKSAIDLIMRIRATLLDEVVVICEAMRDRALRASVSSPRVLYAKSFFDKCTFHGRSICLLIEPLKNRRAVDLAGICALARSLIEAHNVFLYLTEPRLSSAERELRLGLMHLNESFDLRRISDALGIPENDPRTWMQSASADWSRDELERNEAFLALDEKQRNHLLRGKTPYLMDRYDGPRPIDRKIEAAAYNVFSHNLHSYGLSSSYAGSWTPAGYANLLFLATEISLIFMAHTAKRYQAVRGRALGALPTTVSDALEDVLSLRHFNDWKAMLQSQGSQ